MAASSLLDSEKVKTVKTDSFRLEGHLLKWKEAMICIDNVSMVTASDLPLPPFPVRSIMVIIAGLVLCAVGIDFYYEEVSPIGALGIFVTAVGVLWIVVWGLSMDGTAGLKHLNLFMNSGYTYSILFRDNQFLDEVLKTLEDIFTREIDERTSYTFNIKDCKIENGSLVNRGTFNNRLR